MAKREPRAVAEAEGKSAREGQNGESQIERRGRKRESDSRAEPEPFLLQTPFARRCAADESAGREIGRRDCSERKRKKERERGLDVGSGSSHRRRGKRDRDRDREREKGIRKRGVHVYTCGGTSPLPPPRNRKQDTGSSAGAGNGPGSRREPHETHREPNRMCSLSFFRLADGSLHSEPEKRLSLWLILVSLITSGRSSLFVASAWLPSPLTPLPTPWLRAVCVPRGFANRRVCACVYVAPFRRCLLLVAIAWQSLGKASLDEIRSTLRRRQGSTGIPEAGRGTLFPPPAAITFIQFTLCSLCLDTYTSSWSRRRTRHGLTRVLHVGDARGSIRHGSTRGNCYTCAIGEVNPDEGERSGTPLTSSA